MGRRRRVHFPALSYRVLLAMCCALLVLCAATGAAMRASLTDYNSDIGALDALPFVVRPALKERLRLASDDEVLRQMTAAFGEDASLHSLAEGADALGISRQNLSDGAELVLTGTFAGKRTYGYQAFASEIEVTSVIKGSGVSVGDVIVVYEGFEVLEPGNFTGMGQFSTAREIVPAGMTPNSYGAGFLREGEEYLFFLNQKRDGAHEGASDAERRYCQVNSPYGHVSLSVPSDSGQVRVSPILAEQGAGDERILLKEARRFDMFVTDETAKQVYLESCENLLAEYVVR